jgi:hypothetical protein
LAPKNTPLLATPAATGDARSFERHRRISEPLAVNHFRQRAKMDRAGTGLAACSTQAARRILALV